MLILKGFLNGVNENHSYLEGVWDISDRCRYRIYDNGKRLERGGYLVELRSAKSAQKVRLFHIPLSKERLFPVVILL